MSIVQGTIAAEDRVRWLEKRLKTKGAVTIADASTALGVSEMTIRRDLAELEERGVVRRVRGGARAIGPETFATRRHMGARAKSRIASKLASLIPTSGAIAFDASSTVMRVCPNLDQARDLTVLTNGPDTFAALHDVLGVTPLLTGGQRDDRTGSLVGPLACRTARQLSVQVFFASAAAVDASVGALEATLEEAELKRSMAAGAEQIVLAVDGSKLGRRAMALALEWNQIGVLVTDLDPHDRRLDPYRIRARII